MNKMLINKKILLKSFCFVLLFIIVIFGLAIIFIDPFPFLAAFLLVFLYFEHLIIGKIIYELTGIGFESSRTGSGQFISFEMQWHNLRLAVTFLLDFLILAGFIYLILAAKENSKKTHITG